MKSALAASAVLLLIATPALAQPPPEDGEELEVEARPPGAPDPTTPAQTTPAQPTELEALRAQIEALQRRVDVLEKSPPAQPEAPARTRAQAPYSSNPITDWLHGALGVGGFDLSSYLQVQYEWHQDSEDQLQQGGSPLNQDRFLLRRGRLRLDAAWDWSALSFEIDGNTTRGPSFSVRRAEASLLWRGPWGPPASNLDALRGGGPPPLMMLTAGITEIPFGFELTHSARERVFTERTTGSLALFPGEPDVGARLSGGVAFFRYSLAVLNGEPLDERSGKVLRENNDDKDFVGRLGVDFKPMGALAIAGGVSALRGAGFHAGTDGTKDGVQWNDINENGGIDPGELVASPGAAATPSENFSRWGIGVDLRVRVETPIGDTLVYGEVALAQNLDRGLFVADPVLTGVDVRELTGYAAVLQELSEYAMVGLRVDFYEPNADFLDSRGGKLLPTSQLIRTISPVVAGGMPGLWRVALQYDNVSDALDRDDQAVPSDLANDRFTARLQVSL